MTNGQVHKEARLIVSRIGNIANRPDLRQCQEGQVKSIVDLVDRAVTAALAREWERVRTSYPHAHFCTKWNKISIYNTCGCVK